MPKVVFWLLYSGVYYRHAHASIYVCLHTHTHTHHTQKCINKCKFTRNPWAAWRFIRYSAHIKEQSILSKYRMLCLSFIYITQWGGCYMGSYVILENWCKIADIFWKSLAISIDNRRQGQHFTAFSLKHQPCSLLNTHCFRVRWPYIGPLAYIRILFLSSLAVFNKHFFFKDRFFAVVF